MATGTLVPFIFSQAFDNDGNPASAKKLWVYEAGTTNLADTWSDAGLTVLNTNPIVLNAAARFQMFMASGTYDFYLAEPGDVTVPPTSPIAQSLGVTVTSEGESAVFTIMGDSTLNIAAGTLVYMSDGTSGTIGNWYTTDSAAIATSSGARLCGWTLTAIGPANAPGLIHIFGSITIATLGFADGSDLYVGSAGAATDTPPTNQRWIGKMTATQTMFMNGFGDPPASATLAGLVTTTAQTFTGVKTMTAPVFLGGGSWAGSPSIASPAFTALPTGIGAFVTSYATGNTTKNNNTTLVDVTGLSFAVAANASYIFQFIIHGISTVAANWKMTLTGPAAPTALRYGIRPLIASANATSQAAFASNIVVNAAGSDEAWFLMGQLRNGANSGTVQFQFSQNTGDVSNTVIYAESCVMAWRIA
jgi:hypothetical protein